MTNTVTLYHTAGCHLCEKAKEILWPLLSLYPITLVECDIAESDLLIDTYGTRIPVLRSASGDELNWPFDKLTASHYIANLKIQSE